MKRLGIGVLIATSVAFSAFLVMHVAVGRVPSEAATRLTSAGLALETVLWVMADARVGRRTPCYDFGFLVAVFFPVSLVWYMLWSRGRRGFLTLGALVGLLAMPWVSFIGAWILRYGMP
jgi:hypothetical protein